MDNFPGHIEPNFFEQTQDSYIAINQYGIVIDQCSTDGEVDLWMEKHTEHRLLITSTNAAIKMLGKALPANDQEVLMK